MVLVELPKQTPQKACIRKKETGEPVVSRFCIFLYTLWRTFLGERAKRLALCWEFAQEIERRTWSLDCSNTLALGRSIFSCANVFALAVLGEAFMAWLVRTLR